MVVRVRGESKNIAVYVGRDTPKLQFYLEV